MEFVRQTIEISGCKLALARGGKGAPLLYLHGADGLGEWPLILDPEEVARLAYADPNIGEKAAARAGTEKYQDVAILNRIASARFGWQPRFFNPRLERWLHRVNIPTHIIWGDGDRIIPPAYAEAFHRLIPGSTLTMIPKAGHLPHVEQAEAVAEAIQSFLRN